MTRLIEPLLWLGVAVGVLWAFAAWDAGFTHAIGLQAALLALVLLVSAGIALVCLRRGRGAGWAMVAGVALIASGLGFLRVDDITDDLRVGYVVVPIVAGSVLVVAVVSRLVASAPRTSTTTPERPGLAGWITVAVLGLFTLGGVAMLLDANTWGWIGVDEDYQSAWEYGTPAVLLTTGMAAATLHASRRRWPAVICAVLLAIAAFGVTYALATWD